MKVNQRAYMPVYLLTGLAAIACGSVARGDVGPPVEIKMKPKVVAAQRGQAYEGVFVVRVYQAGVLDDIFLQGEGWRVLSVDAPAGPAQVTTGDVLVSFKAVPSDANEPIGLSLTFDGKRVAQQYAVGPRAHAYHDALHRSVQVPDKSGVRPGGKARSGPQENEGNEPRIVPHEDAGYNTRGRGRVEGRRSKVEGRAGVRQERRLASSHGTSPRRRTHPRSAAARTARNCRPSAE